MGEAEQTTNLLQEYQKDFSWSFWFTLPLYPYNNRRTIRQEIIKDTIWTFEQLQGIFYVVVPIRMTIVKLAAGGLLVYAPVAPTSECIRLVNELVLEHGDIKYIILPTISGLEHKVFVGPFARYFPKAQVFVAPNQWSFPFNLPLNWLGFPPQRTQILPKDSSKTPFFDDFDYAILGPIDLKTGHFGEVAFFHRRSRTLLVTDIVISVPETPTAIVQIDSYPLLFHAKDNAADIVADNYLNRCKGWQRISLFALYFKPSVLEISPWDEVFYNALKVKERSKKSYFGLFPFKWSYNWKQSFDILRGNGRLFVAPILQSLILNRAPKETIAWANQVASWDFQWIIPGHFDTLIKANSEQFRQAFSFLEKQASISFNSNTYPLPEDDFQVLRNIDISLNKLGVVPPPQDKI